jgi:hypothetical protein
MGVVADFVESNDLGWDITRGEFLVRVLEELPQYPMVAVVLTGNTTALVNRNYVRVRVVNPKDERGNTEQDSG